MFDFLSLICFVFVSISDRQSDRPSAAAATNLFVQANIFEDFAVKIPGVSTNGWLPFHWHRPLFGEKYEYAGQFNSRRHGFLVVREDPSQVSVVRTLAVQPGDKVWDITVIVFGTSGERLYSVHNVDADMSVHAFFTKLKKRDPMGEMKNVVLLFMWEQSDDIITRGYALSVKHILPEGLRAKLLRRYTTLAMRAMRTHKRPASLVFMNESPDGDARKRR